jgi:archaellum component FlaF (FlaF/FlaG flagellin family)
LGFSNIMAAALAFSVLMGIFYILQGQLPEGVVDLDSEISSKYDDLSSRASTCFRVVNLSYRSDAGVILCYLLNSGSLALAPEDLSVLVDGIYIDESTDEIGRNLGGDVRNPGLWDPEETLEINMTRELSEGNHVLKVFYSNGVYALGYLTVMNASLNWTLTYVDPAEGTVDDSCEIVGLGVAEDSTYLYFRMNLSGEVSKEGVYNWYIDLDDNSSTGASTGGPRTLVEYPNGTTTTYPEGAGIDSTISFSESTATLFSSRDLVSVLEEEGPLDSCQPSGTSIMIRVPKTDLGIQPSGNATFSFYAYSLDSQNRVDRAPDP